MTCVPSTARMSSPGSTKRLELRPIRIVVRELQARDARQIDDVDRELLAAQTRGRHVVAHRLAQREEREVEAAVGRAVHRRAFPRPAGLELREDLHARRLEALGRRRDAQIAAAADRAVAGQHGEMLRRQRVFDQPAGPQMPHAVAPVVRAEHRGPGEQDDGEDRERRRRPHVQIRNLQCDGDPRASFSASSASSPERRGLASAPVNDAVVGFEAAVEVRSAAFDVA